MFSYLKQIWNSKSIRNKILFTLLIVALYRLLTQISVPGADIAAIQAIFNKNQILGVFSILTGGSADNFSILLMGLSPYINASIVFQLLGTVIPALDETRKEGPEGRRKISMYTRLLTVPLAILQSFVIYSTLLGFGLITKLGPLELATMVATFTAGSVVMMWFGELISESGLGGGTSYLIMLGILAGIPGSIRSNFLTMDNLQKTLFIVISLIMVTSVVIITTAERRVKVQYSRRVRTGGALESYIPIKLTQSGVMPVIFAMAFLSFPQLVGKFLVSKNYNEGLTNVAEKVLDFINNPYIKDGLTFLLVIGFSFVYLSVVFKTDELAENLQKQGAFIQGIRPGENTSDYLRKISLRLAAVGAIFLALLSILPDLFVRVGLVNGAVFSGTGLLIVIGVILEIKRQVESMVTTRSYDRYL